MKQKKKNANHWLQTEQSISLFLAVWVISTKVDGMYVADYNKNFNYILTVKTNLIISLNFTVHLGKKILVSYS
jgi:hypothetical protein